MSELYTREEAIRIHDIVSRIGLCTCGTDEAGWKIVLEVLKEGAAHGYNSETKKEADPKGFYRDRHFEFAAKVCDSWGLLEHGTGIGWAWLTPDGKLFLRFLNDFDTDDNIWPDWVHVHQAWDPETGNQIDLYAMWVAENGGRIVNGEEPTK